MDNLSGVNVPDGCKDCSFLAMLQLHIDELNDEIDEIIQTATSDILDKGGKATVDLLKDMLSEDLQDGLSAEEAATASRALSGFGMEMINERITAIKNRMASHALGCQGVLELHGSTDTRKYTVKVCASPRFSDGKSVQPAEITREII